MPGLAACALTFGVTLGAIAVHAPAGGAWPGDPDGSWGACGLRRVDVVNDQASEATSVALDADGRYLVGGSVGTRALVAAFLADGALDPTFGTAGKAPFVSGSDASVAALTRQTDGKILVAGTRTSSGAVDSLVARLSSTGHLDSTFNGTGKLVLDLADADRLTAIQVQTNGTIVVGGTAGPQGVVARVTASGAPDVSFDGDGRRTGLPLTVQALVLQPDGKIVIGGRSAGNDFALMRLNSDGSTDSGFGGSTGVADDLGGYDMVTALALDADGKILAAGTGHGAKGSGHSVLRRYNSDGTHDTGFQSLDRAFGLGDQLVAVVVRGDGKVVVAGNSKVGSDNDVLLVRLNSDGTRDQSFGIGGVSLQDAGARPVADGIVLRPDGRALVVGSLRADDRQQLALLRYQGDTSAAPRPAQGFVLSGAGALFGFAAGCTSKPDRATGNPAWPGDVARGVAVLPGGRGLEVNAFGSIRAFRFGDGSIAGLNVTGNPTWSQDTARGIAVVPEGTGGYVIDRSGGLHAFRIGSGPKPALPTGTPKWPGQDVARGIALLPNGQGGYVLDATGGLHPFGGAPAAGAGAPSWPGQDRARGVTIAPDGSGGWVVDGSGALYPFGIGANAEPRAAVGGPSWPGKAIARGVAALP